MPSCSDRQFMQKLKNVLDEKSIVEGLESALLAEKCRGAQKMG